MENKGEQADSAVELTSKDQDIDATFAVRVYLASMLVLLAYPVFIGYSTGFAPGGPAEWGLFGDYLGGVVGPIIGVATIVLIVRTLRVTRQEGAMARTLLMDQLTQYKHDFESREHARRLELAEDRVRWLIGYWDQLLDSIRYDGPVGISAEGGLITGQGRTARDILNDPNVRQTAHRLITSEGKESAPLRWNATFNVCVNALDDIAKALEQFLANGGTAQMADAYKRKLAPAVRIFAAVGIIQPQVANKLSVGLFLGPIGRAVK